MFRGQTTHRFRAIQSKYCMHINGEFSHNASPIDSRSPSPIFHLSSLPGSCVHRRKCLIMACVGCSKSRSIWIRTRCRWRRPGPRCTMHDGAEEASAHPRPRSPLRPKRSPQSSLMAPASTVDTALSYKNIPILTQSSFVPGFEGSRAQGLRQLMMAPRRHETFHRCADLWVFVCYRA